MSISFVASSVANTTNTSAASITVNDPSGVQADDQLLAVVATGGASTFSAPTGWTLVGDAFGSIQIALYSRTATSADTSTSTSYTFSFNGSFNFPTGMILCYRGANGIDGTPTFSTGGPGTTASISSTTASGAGDTWIAAVATGNPTSQSAPTGMTLEASWQTNSVALDIYDEASMGSGATGTNSSTLGGTNNFATCSLLPLPGSPAAPSYVPPSVRSFVPVARASNW